jgi:hypothetical protein
VLIVVNATLAVDPSMIALTVTLVALQRYHVPPNVIAKIRQLIQARIPSNAAVIETNDPQSET